MLKLLEKAHSSIKPRLKPLHVSKSFSSTPITHKGLDNFRSCLQKRLDNDPTYDLRFVFKQIKRALPTASQPANVYETAFDVLIRHKRSVDGATIVLHMQKKGLLATNATSAKMMALSLSMELPVEVTIENVVNNICDIVGRKDYAESHLVDLLRIMAIYSVDRGIIAVIVNHFRESRGRLYKPPLDLVPEIVEALVREGEIQKAFTTLEQTPATDAPGQVKTISISYLRLLTALRDSAVWDPHLVDRVLKGVEERKLSKQVPTNLLLAWAVRREKYLSALYFFNIIQKEHFPDIHTYRTLFEMHTTFNYHPEMPRFAPLAPRKLYHEMSLLFYPQPLAEKPTAYLLSTTLTAFMHQRDYAGALVVLNAFGQYDIPLDNSSFYSVVKPLTHRTWADIANKRRVREGQVKFGDTFLGARFDRVVLSPAMVSEVLDKVSRETFSVRDALYFPPPERARGSSKFPTKEVDPEEREKELQTKWGAVKYLMPTMQEMETIDPNPSVDESVVYDPTPLIRLVRRAVFAEILMAGEYDLKRAEVTLEEIVCMARQEMIPGLAEEKKGRDNTALPPQQQGQANSVKLQATPTEIPTAATEQTQIPKIATCAN